MRVLGLVERCYRGRQEQLSIREVGLVNVQVSRRVPDTAGAFLVRLPCATRTCNEEIQDRGAAERWLDTRTYTPVLNRNQLKFFWLAIFGAEVSTASGSGIDF